jgi:hypothetical protein
VWSGWTDFISKQEGAPAFPSTTTPESAFFDRRWSTLTNGFNPLYRRAFKLCYNEYFGTESIGSVGEAWYDDITADTANQLNRTKNPEDFASKMTLDGTVVDPEFNVVASAIPLNDFYRQMMNARSQQRSQMTGDKYVDTLARMGVDATWMIAERPEFLGTKSQMVGPQLTANTSNTDTGEEVARFQAKLSCSVKNKHFAEHGYVVGVSSCRPMLTFEYRGAADATVEGEWIDSFYSADNLQTKDQTGNYINGFAAESTANVQRFGYLKNGQWLNGASPGSAAGTSWNLQPSASSFSEMIYPSGSVLPIGSELGTADYAITSSFSVSGKTPVPNKVA